MLFLVWRAGHGINKSNHTKCSAMIVAVLSFTIIEGLRFGRGIDYNLYLADYINLEMGADLEQDIGFYLIVRLLISLGLSWQYCVIIMSFVFIFSVIFFLQSYKESIQYALPLFILFSFMGAENLMRWHLAFSFVLLGLYFQLSERQIMNYKFLIFSAIGCSIHYAFFPIAFIFFLLFLIKKPLLSPFPTVILFLSFSVLLETSIVENLFNKINALGFIEGKYSNYIDNAGFWASKAVSKSDKMSFIKDYESYIAILIVLSGYTIIKNSSFKYVYAYNLFLIGMIFRPFSKQVELLYRYDLIFFYFRAIIMAYLLYNYYQLRNVISKFNSTTIFVLLFIALFAFTQPLRTTIGSKDYKLLFVWDKGKETPWSLLKKYDNDK